MKKVNILALLLLALDIRDDVVGALNYDVLSDTLESIQDEEDVPEDEALRIYAKGLDDAFDWKRALDDYGVAGDIIGNLLEMVDDKLWYYGLKARFRFGSGKEERQSRRRAKSVHSQVMRKVTASKLERLAARTGGKVKD